MGSICPRCNKEMWDYKKSPTNNLIWGRWRCHNCGYEEE